MAKPQKRVKLTVSGWETPYNTYNRYQINDSKMLISDIISFYEDDHVKRKESRWQVHGGMASTGFFRTAAYGTSRGQFSLSSSTSHIGVVGAPCSIYSTGEEERERVQPEPERAHGRTTRRRRCRRRRRRQWSESNGNMSEGFALSRCAIEKTLIFAARSEEEGK